MEDNFFTTNLYDVIVAKKNDEPLSESCGLFLVMDYVPDDIKKMMDGVSISDFTEDHVKVIMYNMLCSLNFLRTTNLMHRDIKPRNMLIDSQCMVKLCDFGLARTIPKYQKPSADLLLKTKGEVGSDSDTEDTTPNTSEEIPRSYIKNDKYDVSARRLSMHVQSRWYRAPEVILTEEKYDA